MSGEMRDGTPPSSSSAWRGPSRYLLCTFFLDDMVAAPVSSPCSPPQCDPLRTGHRDRGASRWPSRLWWWSRDRPPTSRGIHQASPHATPHSRERGLEAASAAQWPLYGPAESVCAFFFAASPPEAGRTETASGSPCGLPRGIHPRRSDEAPSKGQNIRWSSMGRPAKGPK